MADENDDKRFAITQELIRRAHEGGLIAKYFLMMTPETMQLRKMSENDPAETMAVVLAMLSHVATIVYHSATTKVDTNVRTSDDFANIAAMSWDECCRSVESMFSAAIQAGSPVAGAIQERVRLMPSDPSKRPDLPPFDVLAGAKAVKPDSVEDMLDRIDDNAAEQDATGEQHQEETERASEPEEPKSNSVKAPKSEFAVFSTKFGSTNIGHFGNGKGN